MSLANYLDLKLSDLLKLNSKGQTSLTLPLSFGDAFLYQNNLVFKKIRDQFLNLGGTFTTEDFCHYEVLPYASLPKILAQKKVPYKDNVTVLQEIESARPGRFTIGELVKVKSNYVLHESSHCIANQALEKLAQDVFLQKTSLPVDSQKAFRFIMAESFANAIESFANVYNLTGEGRLFYDLNSYVTHNKKVNTSLETVLELLGPHLTFQWIFISYLFSNCLLPEPSSKQMQSLFEFLIPESDLRKKVSDSTQVRKLFAHGFALSLDFRVQTTGFFCTYMGIDTPLEKLLRIDILEILKKTNCVPDFLSSTQSSFT